MPLSSVRLPVRFKEWLCVLDFRTYERADGPTAIRLMDALTGELIAVATVNVPDEPLAPGEVLIKDWSENEGMLDALTRAGIVKFTGRAVPTGRVKAHVCKLLVTPEAAE